MKKKYFIITVDTEGDNIWSYLPKRNQLLLPKTQNAQCLQRFQQLCEKYQFYPTYFVDYEMTTSSELIRFGREVMKKNCGEIGMHMHAFSTPPFYELTDLRGRGLAFAGEYPLSVLFQKMDYMTKTLQDVFQIEILSHRGGRWYLDNRILKILDELGYLVDCTVTPGITWQSSRGQTERSRGSDYRSYKSKVYQVKESNLWELPVTIIKKKEFHFILKDKPPMIARNIWMRPSGENLKDMIWLVNKMDRSNVDYIEFMIHSSELMAGGSPTFKTSEDINQLYQQMDALFMYVKKKGYEGIGCSDYIMKTGKFSK